MTLPMHASDPAVSPFAGLNILYSFHNDPRYMPPVRLSERQVLCGPFFKTESDGGRCLSFKTPMGEYDIAALAARLPPDQRPDLVIVKADASRLNLPRNVAALGCPAVLLVGDTQHMLDPIRTMVAYALSEPYALTVTDHGRRNLHFFAEAGLKKLYWLPGLNLNVYPHRAGYRGYRYPVSHVGQSGKDHPVRAHLLRRVAEDGRPLTMMSEPQSEAAQVYAESQINLNCSLNGDVNLRVFEVLAHGGFLLSDRLKPQAGGSLLFRDGEDFVSYDGEQDLLDKIDYFLQRPEECERIARHGHRTLYERHAPEKRWRQFHDLVFNKSDIAELAATWDTRCTAMPPWSSFQPFDRMAVYEFFQTINRVVFDLPTLAWPGVDPRVLADLADLSRVRLSRIISPSREAALAAFFRAAGVDGQIVGLRARPALSHPWGLVLITASELDALPSARLPSMTATTLLAIVDPPGVVGPERRAAIARRLAPLNFGLIHDGFPVFRRNS